MFITEKENRQLRAEAEQFSKNRAQDISGDDAISGAFAADFAGAARVMAQADEDQGFETFRHQRHAGESAEELFDGLSQGEMLAKMEEIEAKDRTAWEEYKALTAVQFIRQTPEFVLCQANYDAMDAGLRRHRIEPSRASLQQIQEVYQELKANHQLRLQSVTPPAPVEDSYKLSKAELKRRAGTSDPVIDDYIPSPSRFGSAGFTFEPGSPEAR